MFILCTLNFVYEFLILLVENFVKRKKYIIIDDKFIKFTNTKKFNKNWFLKYDLFDSCIKIQSIKNNFIVLNYYKNHKKMFFYRDSLKLIDTLQKMKQYNFIHKDFDFGNLIFVEQKLIILDPDKWVFYKNDFLIDKMIESCKEKNIFKFLKYKKILKKEIESE